MTAIISGYMPSPLIANPVFLFRVLTAHYYLGQFFFYLYVFFLYNRSVVGCIARCLLDQ